MRPDIWQPPIERSPAEQAILGRVRRAKLFVFLRDQRHRLFSAAFQVELAACYPDQSKGRPTHTTRPTGPGNPLASLRGGL